MSNASQVCHNKQFSTELHFLKIRTNAYSFFLFLSQLTKLIAKFSVFSLSLLDELQLPAGRKDCELKHDIIVTAAVKCSHPYTKSGVALKIPVVVIQCSTTQIS